MRFLTRTQFMFRREDCIGLETRTAVEVRETFMGEVFIWRHGHAITLKKIERPARNKTKIETKANAKAEIEAEVKAEAVIGSAQPKEPHKPAEDHPWRKQIREEISKRQTIRQQQHNDTTAP
ncbi:hypothetical protein FACS1894187_08690 [Synergistales bacterium]|nr:hypothetical protein FACS1894187_08690 [Synergistales bacterium]